MWLSCVLADCLLLSWQLLWQLIDIVERWGKRGWLHRDLSLNNVGYGPDKKVLVWDLATYTSTPVPSDPGVYMRPLVSCSMDSTRCIRTVPSRAHSLSAFMCSACTQTAANRYAYSDRESQRVSHESALHPARTQPNCCGHIHRRHAYRDAGEHGDLRAARPASIGFV